MKGTALGELRPSVEVSAGLFRIRNRIFASNTYLHRLSDSGECVVIDPGLDTVLIESSIAALGFRPIAILCTHGHFDHVGSASHLQRKYGAPLYLHSADERIMRSSNFLMKMCKIECQIITPTVDVFVESNGVYILGGNKAGYHHMPGHTPGSCFVSLGGALFTGDSLYRDGVALVELPGENPEQLKQSLIRAWTMFPDNTLVCPGHGGAGSLGDIKRNNGPLLTFLGRAEG